ncbi:uncharacterized protein LOC127731951 [Mytilus californianus]|uniref:uncharacterized protein LOC127731951 n=1 Tax=Mytilus californianus TaxID=6549 RepID=UPI0022454638|nr:uncharacterized protein LOC127731951 [Mytilus californianus]
MNFHQVESYNDLYKHKVMGITTMTIYCSPCILWKKYITAAVCCLDCKDRKPLCNSCAKQHRAMKKTRGHLSFPLDVPNSRDQIKFPSKSLEVRYSGPDVKTTQLVKSTKVKLPNGNGIDTEESSSFISRSDQIESQAQQLNKGPDSGQSVLKTLSVEPMMNKFLHIKLSETKETTRYEMSLRGVYV